MITLILPASSAGSGPSAPWCSRTSRYGTNWPSSSAPRRVHACGRRPAVLGPAVPPMERLDGCRLRRPTRDRDPVAARRLQARLDLEEPPERTRSPAVARRSERSSDGCPRRTPSGARRGFTGSSRNWASRSRRRRSPSTSSAIGGRHRRPGAPFSQPPPEPGLRGLLHRAHRDVQGLVRLRGPGARPATRRAHQRHRRPHGPWTAQQLVEAFPWETAPRYSCATAMRSTGSCSRAGPGLGIHEVKTAPRSPWQNPYVERLIGTLRRECLDHMVVLTKPICVACCETTSPTTTVSGRTSPWTRTPGPETGRAP